MPFSPRSNHSPSSIVTTSWPLAVILGLTGLGYDATAADTRAVHAAPSNPTAALVDHYCLDCHDSATKKGGVSLEELDATRPAANPEAWERVVRKLSHRQMPPIGEARPDEAAYNQVVASLQSALDRAAQSHPNPGRTDTFRRLNRTEYQNAVRDLLGVQIDAAALLPNDESSHGFDNVTVGNLSPTLLDRYVTAAERISRLAVGTPLRTPGGDTIRIRPDITQEEHVEGLPVGTRGGALIPYEFSEDGEYEIQIRLTRDRNEMVEGLFKPHDVELLLDRARVAAFTVAPPEGTKSYEAVDQHLRARVQVKAGPHQLGVTFPKNPSDLLETERQPFTAHFNMHRHPRITPAVYQVSITGPYGAASPGDTPSRRLIFGTELQHPADPAAEEAGARKILSNLMRRAYRRPVTEDDFRKPMEFFRDGRANGGFDAGIESALSAVLVSPRFLFRVEADPAGVAPGKVYPISDLELASRLSFFLWSSIPDDELLDAAVRGDLRRPAVLEHQVRRMLADDRAASLATNFANQWLYLRNLDSMSPDLRLFPDFDDNLRQSMRQETELFFESIQHEDRSVLDLLKSDYTFLNERLAKHYGIPNIYGSRFRRVTLDPASHRGGLLRQGSILTVTSYATRTAPTIRGKWIMENFFGTPPIPPPPNVPALKESTVSASLPMRARLAEHRANPACASCHNLIDPAGFALENFDAIGRWRTVEDGQPIDPSGGLPDGSTCSGVTGLEQGLLARPEIFAGTMTEKLLTYALGRGVEDYDAPAIRQVLRQARTDNYRFSSLILGLVNSTPFQMRKSP
jgi:Protein of unknown function (DUF1592)/Protein of unknown function (DUF1588)/Protein of unknown function (DUF1585)/Protein of unknown function (DUF1587)/Protein of unknown function (DUF1595)/Planctomycete cytochrome C